MIIYFQFQLLYGERDNHLLNKPQVIRHLFVLLNFLDSELEQKQKKRSKRKCPSKVVLTLEQLERVELPEGLIGINELHVQ